MKKLLALLLAMSMLAALAACGSASGADAEPTPAPTPEAAGDEDESGPTAESPEEQMPPAEPEPDPELAALVDAIYAACPVELMMMETHAIELSNADGMAGYNTGLDETALALLDAAVINQSMTGSQAYSLILARVKNADDAETAAVALLEKAPTDKWICVVPNAVRTARYGDVICCVMTDTTLADPDALIAAFTEAAGGCDAQDGRDFDGAEALCDGVPVFEVPDDASADAPVD